MKPAGIHFRKLILVCTNERENGEACCAARGSVELHAKIKAAVKAANPSVRVSQAGCLGNCATGITVVIMPDDVWLGDVQETDIPEIVRMVLA